MAKRRGFLGVIISAIVGAMGYAYYRGDKDLPEIEGEQTDTIIKTVEQRGLITKIEFYDSGEATIHLKKDHGCYDTLQLLNAGSELQFGEYEAPEFQGPIRVDLKQVVAKNGPYDTNRFKFNLVAKDSVCFTKGKTNLVFKAPESYMP